MSFFPLLSGFVNPVHKPLAKAAFAKAAVAAALLVGFTDMSFAGGAMNDVVGIVKVTPNEKAKTVAFTVCEREPYDKQHYDITVFRSMPPKFLLTKIAAPRSAFDEPRLIDLVYSFDELGVGPGQQFYLQNPLALPSC